MTKTHRSIVKSAQAALLLAVWLFLGAGAARAAETYSKLDAPQLLNIMKAEGYSVQLDEDKIKWKLDGQNCFLLFMDQGAAVQFFFGVAGTETALEDVNTWNRTKRYSRGYLDERGNPCLELDLDLAGGVDAGRVVNWLQTCVVSMSRWRSEVLDKK